MPDPNDGWEEVPGQDSQSSEPSADTSSSDGWEPVPDAPANNPSVGDEALKVVGQAAVGASQGLLDVGNKPFSELLAGEVGSKIMEGAFLSKKIREASKEDIASTIKKFVESGPMGIAQSMQVDQGDTLQTKYGFPVLPQPETGVGKALGIVANVAAQGATLGALEDRFLPSSNLKTPKTSQIEEAINKIDSNVSTIKETNRINKFKTQDAIDVNKLEQNIKDNTSLEKLTVDKTKLADSTALEIQGTPGNKGLGVKASQELGKKFYEDYKVHGDTLHYVDDLMQGPENTLKQYGIIDGNGERIPDAPINEPQARLLSYYEKLKGDKPGEVQFEPKKMTLEEFDKGLKNEVFGKGKQYGSEEHILTDVRHSLSNILQPLREVGAKYAPDFQLRNAVYDKFHIFDRIGFRRGSADQTSGMGVLKNLSSEDPAQVLPQNQRMMDFLKQYGGSDPSEPIKQVGQRIVGIKKSAISRDIGSKVLMQNLERDIFNTNIKADQEAANMKASLGRLYESARTKEASAALKKQIALIAGASAAGAVGGAKVFDVAKKFIP